eukprot:Sro602_g173770.2  (254) ;mRNA; r:43638-44399
MEHPDFLAAPEWRKRQLFGLMSLYYSAMLSWEVDSSVHECKWRDKSCKKTDVCQKLCSWCISCTEDGRIERLIIQPNSPIQGSIPPEVSMLSSHLRELKFQDRYLSRNIQWDATWSLPTELGMLSNLESFDVTALELTGVVPTEFGAMSALANLSLRSHIRLVGEIPSELGLATSLTNLQLEDHKFHGQVPSELGKLRKLRTLKINKNLLSGTVPEEICSLRHLEAIRVDCQSFSSCCGGDPNKCRCSRPKRH